MKSSGASIVRISAKNSLQLSFPNCSETRSSSSATLYVGLSVDWGKLAFVVVGARLLEPPVAL